MPTLTVTLSDETQAFVDRQVAEGRNPSAEEYVLALVQQDQKRQARRELEAMLAEEMKGPMIVMDQGDWESIRREALEGLTSDKIPS